MRAIQKGVTILRRHLTVIIVIAAIAMLSVVASIFTSDKPLALSPTVSLNGNDTSGWVTQMTWSLDGMLLAVGREDGSIQVWSTSDWELVTTFEGHTELIRSIIWSNDSRSLVSSSSDATVIVWDLDTNRPVEEIPNQLYDNLEWVADTEELVGFNQTTETLDFWNLSDAHIFQTISNVKGVWDFSSPFIAWVNQNDEIEINRLDEESFVEFIDYPSQIHSLSFSPNGTQIATANADNTTRIWERSSGSLVRTLEHLYPVLNVMWSPDGNTIATISGNEFRQLSGEDLRIYIWNANTQQSIWVLRVNPLVRINPFSVTWSPDGTKLAAYGFPHESQNEWSGTAWIWNVETGELLATLEHPAPLSSILWSSDGGLIATGSTDGNVRIWNISDLADS